MREDGSDVLGSREAGALAIRGGAGRVAAYAAGVLLTATAAVLALRHLGLVEFGRYATVIAILGVVGALADAGLTVVGQRAYVDLRDGQARRRLVANIAGIRVTVAPLGVLAAAGFGGVVGYPPEMVIGTLIAGIGVCCSSAAVSLTIPLTSSLRLGAVASVELARQVVLALSIAALVAADAGLLAFFGAQLVSGAAMLAAAFALPGRRSAVFPRFALADWRPILREAAPVAASLVVNVVYLRTLIVIVSLTGAALETGRFGMSSRVLEMFVAIPMLMVGSAFPILARAGAADEARLRSALERLAEAALLVAGGFVIALVLAAEAVVAVLGGSGYASAVPVLQLQAFMLLGAFLTQVWSMGLVAVRAQSALVRVNVLALVSVLVSGWVLVPPFGATGAAAAAVAGESVLALASVTMLVRARPLLRPRLSRLLRILAAGAAGAACALLPSPPAVDAIAGLAVYATVAWRLGAVPIDVVNALLRRPSGSAASTA